MLLIYRKLFQEKPNYSAWAARNSSTSARSGAPVPPPNRVHLMRGSGRRKAHGVRRCSWPSASASAKAPWKTSPARERVDGLDAKGRQRAQIAVFEPHHVAGAVGDGHEGAGALRDAAQRGFEIVHAARRRAALRRKTRYASRHAATPRSARRSARRRAPRSCRVRARPARSAARIPDSDCRSAAHRRRTRMRSIARGPRLVERSDADN